MANLGYFLGGVAVGAGVMYALRKTWKIGPASIGPVLGDAGPASIAALPANAVASTLGVHVRQIRRYAFASSQDISPIVGITHASYALVLLDTLQEIVGKDAIDKAGYNADALRTFITGLQDKHAQRLEKCDEHLQQVLKIEKAENKGRSTPGFVLAGGAPLGA